MNNRGLKYHIHIIVIILIGIYGHLMSQDTPPVEYYQPGTYQAENQNWDVDQDQDKVMYVANNKGLLEYDGAEWTLYTSPNRTIIRSIFTSDEKIFTGAYMEFGYWQRDLTGILTYTNLSDKIAPMIEDEIIWHINQLDNWIVFQSYDRIYYFNKDTEEISFTTDLNNYYRIYKVGNSLYLQKRDGQVYIISNGGEQLSIPIPPQFNIKIITGIYKEKNDLILVTRDQGFFRVHQNKISPMVEFYSAGIDKLKIFSSLRLTDGSFAIGTISQGVFHLSSSGRVLAHIDQSAGLGNNTVLGLYEDNVGNVWAALDNGISCINMNSYIRDYNEIDGSIGTVYTSIIYDDLLYVGSNQGLFYKRKDRNEKLTQIDGMEGQIWSLSIHQGDLLCGHTRGTFRIKGTNYSQITDFPGTWKISDISGSDMALQGHYAGLSVIEKKDGNWELHSRMDQFENSARFFEIINGHDIWVNHEYKGVYRIEVNDSWTDIISTSLVEQIPRGEGSSLFTINDTLYYAYQKGVFKVDPYKKSLSKDTTYSALIDSNHYVSGMIIPDQKGLIWAFNQYMINYAQQGPVKSQFIIKEIPIHNNWRKTTASFENITNIREDTYLVGKYNGYFLINLQKYKPIDHKIKITKVSIGSNNKTVAKLIPINSGKEISINYKERNIVFNYSVPVFDKYSYTLYQYKLSGVQDEWSSWQEQSNHTFEKLPFGEYEFEVRSKIGNRISVNTATYKFKILRPYYLSTPMLIFYIAGGILLLYLAQRWNSRSLRLQNKKIIEANQRKVELLRLQNEKELTQLKNEKLNQEIKAKNNEMAILTMSTIKRHEILLSIQKELKSHKEINKKHAVFKLIEQNLNTQKDWEFFKRAFDNVDKEFFKRATTLHPDLTHNDLKFMAYLRLNLSSKEIAPLLNITLKSVEVRRSRLRKKLGLDRKTNLTDYILGI